MEFKEVRSRLSIAATFDLNYLCRHIIKEDGSGPPFGRPFGMDSSTSATSFFETVSMSTQWKEALANCCTLPTSMDTTKLFPYSYTMVLTWTLATRRVLHLSSPLSLVAGTVFKYSLPEEGTSMRREAPVAPHYMQPYRDKHTTFTDYWLRAVLIPELAWESTSSRNRERRQWQRYLLRSSGGIRNALCRATRERNETVVQLLLKFDDGDSHGEQYVGALSDALAEVSGKIDDRDIAVTHRIRRQREQATRPADLE
ncbi:hypothetical protein DFH08DRAFT_816069 [Mycena albidolilacea]|uniref:Uncharacterized protein n=1 Tax=Mycena albidolilacea TaxID=1033008 RepID=A0AAD6ZKY3_9AGAR|nr:hypothetical protein DFH08DRAFT_816069 [Mycena albidolilacea]